MAHFAKVRDGVVVEVIVASPEFFDTFVDTSPGEWIQTSYNTRRGVHYEPTSDVPSADQSKALRKNFAGIGYTYNADLDAFIPPKPYQSWVLDEVQGVYVAPVPPPTDNDDTTYVWNEALGSWEEYVLPPDPDGEEA